MIKKVTLLIGGCLLAASAVSAFEMDRQSMRYVPSRSDTNVPYQHNARPAEGLSGFKADRSRLSPVKMRKMAANAAESGFNVITEAPAGEVKTYAKSSAGYYPIFGYLFTYEDVTSATVVFGDDGKVYFKDLVTMAVSNSYVEGTVEGNTITVSLPQCVLFDEVYGYGYNVSLLRFDAEEEFYLVDEEVTSVTFTIGEDDTISLNIDEDCLLGLTYTDDKSWSGYGDAYMSYEPFNEVANEVPAGLTGERWAMLSGDESHFVDVYSDGTDIYVKGISLQMPDAVVKGTINGDKVTFDTEQYLGIYSNSFMYLLFAKGELEWDDYYEDYLMTYKPVAGPQEYTYDAAAKTLVPVKPDLYMLVNGGKEEVYYLSLLTMPEFKYQEIKPAVPAKPVFEYYDDAIATSGYIEFTFLLPPFDTEGNLIDTDNYHYNIYLDGEVFTFYSDEYQAVEDEITDIPYYFTDDYDFVANGARHMVTFYCEGMETVGVQGFYTVDGVTKASEILTYDVAAAGIGAVRSDVAKEVSGITYYDLTGREIARPASGMFIQKTVYADGSVESVKKIVK